MFAVVILGLLKSDAVVAHGREQRELARRERRDLDETRPGRHRKDSGDQAGDDPAHGALVLKPVGGNRPGLAQHVVARVVQADIAADNRLLV